MTKFISLLVAISLAIIAPAALTITPASAAVTGCLTSTGYGYATGGTAKLVVRVCFWNSHLQSWRVKSASCSSRNGWDYRYDSGIPDWVLSDIYAFASFSCTFDRWRGYFVFEESTATAEAGASVS